MAMNWRAFCEVPKCKWHEEHVESRDAAVVLGRAHTEEKHANEWSFRVQGIRSPDSIEEAFVTLRTSPDGGTYRAHYWVPKPSSRDRYLPCGICSVYRDFHRYASPLVAS